MQTTFKGVDIEVNDVISKDSARAFGMDIYESCFNDKGEYDCFDFDYNIRKNIIERYMNLAIPEDTDEAYKLAYSGIVEFGREFINDNQLASIIKSAKEMIKFRKATGLDRLNRQMEEVVSLILDTNKSLNSVVSDKDLVEALKTIKKDDTNGKSIEDKIVDAYLKTVK